jgi:glycosyltransferase involved in cell wall biosynthesis
MTTIDICLVKYTLNDEEEHKLAEVKKYFSNLKVDGISFNVLIHDNNKNNIGLSKARNALLKKCIGEYVCFSDFDITIEHIEWKDIVNRFIENAFVSIIAPISKTSSGLVMNTVDQNERWQAKKYLACNLMICRKTVLEKFGGCDERFFVAYSDWDIIKQCLENGYVILQDNLSSILHHSFSNHNEQKSEIWKKDYAAFIEKHGKPLDRSLL